MPPPQEVNRSLSLSLSVPSLLSYRSLPSLLRQARQVPQYAAGVRGRAAALYLACTQPKVPFIYDICSLHTIVMISCMSVTVTRKGEWVQEAKAIVDFLCGCLPMAMAMADRQEARLHTKRDNARLAACVCFIGPSPSLSVIAYSHRVGQGQSKVCVPPPLSLVSQLRDVMDRIK